MRSLIIVAVSIFPIFAWAQTAPADFTIPAPVAQHIVQYLQLGGTHAESQALAEQVIALLRHQVTPQKTLDAPAK